MSTEPDVSSSTVQRSTTDRWRAALRAIADVATAPSPELAIRTLADRARSLVDAAEAEAIWPGRRHLSIAQSDGDPRPPTGAELRFSLGSDHATLTVRAPRGRTLDAADEALLADLATAAGATLAHHDARSAADASRAAAVDRELRVRAAVHAGGVGIWDFDPQSGTLTIDSHGKTILEQRAVVPVGGGWDQLLARVAPEDRERVQDTLQRALDPEGEGTYRDEYRLVSDDRRIRWVESVGRAFFDAERRPIRLTGTFRDITDRKEAERERDRVIDELARTVKFSETFVGILAHDLRNPLAAMITAAQLSQRTPAGETLAKPLDSIVKSGKRMGRMIDQLLDFTCARIGGGIPLRLEAVDLRTIAEQVVGEHRGAQPEWRIDVHARGETTGSYDADRLAQVLSNLIGNAMQHGSREEGVDIVLDGTNPTHVAIEVSNHGVIPFDVLPLIFEPFRGSNRKRDGSRGLGLGLYVTRQLVLGHGGDVDVVCDRGQTTFRIHLPRRPADPISPRREAGDREVERLAAPPAATAVTAQLFGVVPLHERAPGEYWSLFQRYLRLLDAVIRRQTYKDEPADVSDELRAVADGLGGLRAGAREVAELHARALRQRTRGAPAAKQSMLIAEGRLLALELMGHLVSFYRRRAAFGAMGRE